MTLYSGNTDQYSKAEVLERPLHWHINVGKAGTPLDYQTLCQKLAGPKTMYVRPSSARLGEDIYPPQMRPASTIKDSWWLQPKIRWGDEQDNSYRYYLDIRKPEVRAAVIEWMLLQLEILGRDTLCIDNLCYMTGNPTGTTPEGWTAAEVNFLKELRKTGVPFYVNVACVVDKIPESIRVVGNLAEGYHQENPFHPNMNAIDPSHAKELTAYKQYTRSGRIVMLMPPESRFEETKELVGDMANVYVTSRKD